MSAKKKILVFIDWFLPGYKAGGPVRSMANMVDHLSDHYDFFMVTRNTDYMESTPYADVESDAWNYFQPGVKVFYCSERNASLKKWKELIRETGCDTVYVNGIYSLKFSVLPLIAAKQEKAKRIIIAPRGMLAQSAISVKPLKKKLFLLFSRMVCLYNRVDWHVTNSKEAGEIHQLTNRPAEVFVAANLPRKTLPALSSVSKFPGSLRLCSFARIAPEKNALYAIGCLKEMPDKCRVVFDLYGEIYNADYWKECCRMIQALPKHITVTYKGVVDAQVVGKTMSEYHALFLPTRGENFGHVILESLMVGRPVVISDQTPWRNLIEQQAGWDLVLSSPSGFCETLLNLGLMDQQSFDAWCEGAIQLANRFVHDKKNVGDYLLMLQ